MIQKHCPGCFHNKLWLPVCASCGYDEQAPRSPLFLPHGAMLNHHYRIGRVLGRPGGFGITYLAWDVHLQQRVAIKEYLPRDMAKRADGGSHQVVTLSSLGAEAFTAGIDEFLHEARLIARFEHPNVVRVRSFFQANGTAYFVMDYYAGSTLGDYLDNLNLAIPADTTVRLMGPVLTGLEFVHRKGVLHRDIKPHNIYLSQDGRPFLLDFGAARTAANAGAEAAVMLSEGYAPLEQYQKQGVEGPWTDVYGIAATIYRMIAGRAPPVALDRVGNDALEADLPVDGALGKVIKRGLALAVADRYPSAAEFRDDLFRAVQLSSQDAAAPSADPGRDREPDTGAVSTRSRYLDGPSYIVPPGSGNVAPHELLQTFDLATDRMSRVLRGGLLYVASAMLLGCLVIAAVVLATS